MFVCLKVFFPLENIWLIWRRYHFRWRGANFDLCSALMAIEQWGFFTVPHLLWHVYNGHFRGPVTLTPNAERLAVELSLPVFTSWVCRGWDSNTQPSACEANALTIQPGVYFCFVCLNCRIKETQCINHRLS